jgi:cytochrome P450
MIELFFLQNETMDYDLVNSIEYLDMFINESMRIYPPVVAADRIANADYQYENFKIPKGVVFLFDIWVKHRKTVKKAVVITIFNDFSESSS